MPNSKSNSRKLGTTKSERPKAARGTPPPPPARTLSVGQRWALRVCSTLLVPVAILAGAEFTLRLFNVGQPVTFFVKSGSGRVTTNEKFAWRYYGKRTALKPFLFTMPARKPAGTLRVCILGDSAAMGTPDPAFSFGRMLELELRLAYPKTRIEVINAAMRGIDSWIVNRIAGECAAYDVDIFIVYTGNNEVIGLHGPSPETPRLAQSRPVLAAHEWALSTRLGQAAAGLLGSAAGKRSAPVQDMEFFRRHRVSADDARRRRVRNDYAANLLRLCRQATGSGAKLMLCTVPVNLRDFPPLESAHRPNLSAEKREQWDRAFALGAEQEAQGRWTNAILAYAQAAAIDAHFAELHFRLGRCYEALGASAEAVKCFSAARDWDALQFRMDTEMNELVRAVANLRRDAGVTLVDLEKAFSSGDDGIPGKRLFADHVHPTFEGNYRISLELARRVGESLAGRLGNPTAAPPTRDEIAAALPYTVYDDLNVTSAMVRLTSQPPFLDQLDHAARQSVAEAEIRRRLNAFSPAEAQGCLEAYRRAMAREPDYWPTRFNFGSLCAELGQHGHATEAFQGLVAQFPRCKRFRLSLAEAYLKSGAHSAGVNEIQAALRLEPFDQELRETALRLAQRN